MYSLIQSSFMASFAVSRLVGSSWMRLEMNLIAPAEHPASTRVYSLYLPFLTLARISSSSCPGKGGTPVSIK